MMQHKTRKNNNKTRKNNKTKNYNKTKKYKLNNKIFQQLKCSPNKEYDFTCYTNKSLNKIKKLWNLRHPDHKILTNNTKDIWVSLKNNMKHICSNEKCWLNQHFIKNNLDKQMKKYTFAPNSPSSWKTNPNEWLTSLDIDNVMMQYENKYPSFIFMGPSPIDFDKKKIFGQCVWNELCNFNLKNLIKKNINKVGIIFNTDPHYLQGSHWICMFIDIKKKFIFYFDSNGDKIPKEIAILVKRITKQGENLDINFQYYENKIEHQKSNTECGMYVLYVISELVKNKVTPKTFDKRVSDNEMEELRKVLFN